MQQDCTDRIAGRGRLTSFSAELKTESVGTSKSERCHLHEDQAHETLYRPVARRPLNGKKCTRIANYFMGRHPGTGSTFTRGPLCPQTTRRRPAEGHLGMQPSLRVLPSTPPSIDASVWSGATYEETGLQRNGARLSLATSPDSISEVLDESRSFFRVHTGYFSNIPKCIKAEFIASWACSQSSVVSSSQR
ncbi:hypothetical protein TNCV_2665391 [Trichonephila clavipes]|nr:hypothetical protein TNCV_2665391 [Trichonephila clavipes]